MRLLLAVIAGVAVGGPRAAAQEIRLAYTPVDGVEVHRVFQVYTRVTLRDSASTTREFAELGGMREVALRGADRVRVVHLSYDSLLVRFREGDDPWREAAGRGDSAWMQVHLDSALRVGVTRAGGGSTGARTLLTLITGVPGLTLPTHPVRAGETWEADLGVEPSRGTLPEVTDGTLQLRVRALVTVDSLVVRAHDTLAYLRVGGRVVPEQAFAGSALARVSGALEAQLVWSTGWGEFVSAVTHSRLEAQLRGPARRGTIVVETTIRQQVRS